MCGMELPVSEIPQHVEECEQAMYVVIWHDIV